ncbi:MAG: fumarylacetoacetate hydrolase family protein [Cryomorphaceae bacterium]|nr:fumarylacetoacetate hydrolase family protein [Cryomorphaceae bacterium]
MKIICIGRNYTAHAAELKNDIPDEPVVFLKPDTARLKSGETFYIPSFTNDVHYEAELLVRINRMGKFIDEKFAHKYYNEVSVGIDFTARDLQSNLKSKGLPWERAKAFDGSAGIGEWVSLDELNSPIDELTFSLEKNGERVQYGRASDMLFGVNALIANISRFITLKVGDVIFTGTPAGVSSVKRGDLLTCYLDGRQVFDCKID